MAGRQVGRQGAAGLGLGCKGGHVPWGLVEPALGAISLALSAGVGSLGSGRSQHPSLPRYPPPSLTYCQLPAWQDTVSSTVLAAPAPDFWNRQDPVCWETGMEGRRGALLQSSLNSPQAWICPGAVQP